MHSADTLRRFIFDKGAVRGEIVHLRATWEAVLTRHDYPPVLRARMGEFMAASALLAATLKFEGSLTMQVQTEGPVNLLVVECSSERVMRATKPICTQPRVKVGKAMWRAHCQGSVKKGT